MTKPAKNSICAAAIIASLTISLTGIAAVGGIDHRQFVGVLAQDLRDPPQDFGALERQHAPPFRECRLCRGDRSIDVVGAGFGDLAERLSSAGADRIDKAAGLRLVPARRRNRRPRFFGSTTACAEAACGETAVVMATVRLLRHYWRGEIWINSVICSLLSGPGMNFRFTASGINESRPWI